MPCKIDYDSESALHVPFLSSNGGFFWCGVMQFDVGGGGARRCFDINFD